MRRGFAVVLISLLLLPGSAFALQFNAPPALIKHSRRDRRVHRESLRTDYRRTPYRSAASAASAEQPNDSPSIDAPANSQPATASGNRFMATSTNDATMTVETSAPSERTVYLQPQTIERTVVAVRPASG